jgi:hypothetical protein
MHIISCDFETRHGAGTTTSSGIYRPARGINIGMTRHSTPQKASHVGSVYIKELESFRCSPLSHAVQHAIYIRCIRLHLLGPRVHYSLHALLMTYLEHCCFVSFRFLYIINKFHSSQLGWHDVFVPPHNTTYTYLDKVCICYVALQYSNAISMIKYHICIGCWVSYEDPVSESDIIRKVIVCQRQTRCGFFPHSEEMSYGRDVSSITKMNT